MAGTIANYPAESYAGRFTAAVFGGVFDTLDCAPLLHKVAPRAEYVPAVVMGGAFRDPALLQDTLLAYRRNGRPLPGERAFCVEDEDAAVFLQNLDHERVFAAAYSPTLKKSHILYAGSLELVLDDPLRFELDGFEVGVNERGLLRLVTEPIQVHVAAKELTRSVRVALEQLAYRRIGGKPN